MAEDPETKQMDTDKSEPKPEPESEPETTSNTPTSGGGGGDSPTPNHHEVVQEVTPPALPLEWTKMSEVASDHAMPIRYPSDVCDYSELKDNDEATYLEIVGTAGQKITHMGKDLYRTLNPSLTHLIFRSHMISKMEGIKDFRNLELLELYDNQIEYLEELGEDEEDGDGDGDMDGDRNEDVDVDVDHDDGDDVKHKNDKDKSASKSGNAGTSLKVLDMSYNSIRDMAPIRFCPNLVDLYLASNKIKTLDGLQHLTSLRKIDLGANRIRKMDESQLSCLTNLEELWLGKNKIEKIEGISNLKKLRRLDVQSNRLTCIENLEGQLDTLEELFLAHNGIDDEGAMHPTGLALNFTQLTMLDLSRNRLTSCRPFAHLIALDALWVSSNNITQYEDIEPMTNLGTRDGACLTEVYMEHNPISEDFEYRKKLKEIIPSLVQIDANMIGAAEYGNGVPPTMTQETIMEQMRKYQEKAVLQAKEQQAQTLEESNEGE